jgi:hypothetical protein
MVVVIDVEPIRERFLTVAPFLDEGAVCVSAWKIDPGGGVIGVQL